MHFTQVRAGKAPLERQGGAGGFACQTLLPESSAYPVSRNRPLSACLIYNHNKAQ